MAIIFEPSGVIVRSNMRSRLHWCVTAPARFQTMTSLSTLAEMKFCPSGNHRQTVTMSLCSIVRAQDPDYSVNCAQDGKVYICVPHLDLVVVTSCEEPVIIRGPIQGRDASSVVLKHM